MSGRWSLFPSLEADLRARFGDAVVEGTPAEYLSDISRLRGHADAVVLPETAEQVAEVLAWCYERDVPIVPRGGGTGLAGGAVPDGARERADVRARPRRTGAVAARRQHRDERRRAARVQVRRSRRLGDGARGRAPAGRAGARRRRDP